MALHRPRANLLPVCSGSLSEGQYRPIVTQLPMASTANAVLFAVSILTVRLSLLRLPSGGGSPGDGIPSKWQGMIDEPLSPRTETSTRVQKNARLKFKAAIVSWRWAR